VEIVSWNIQAGLGCDGRSDLERIAGVIQAASVPDVVCLQEVARGMASVNDGAGVDQVALLRGLFPGYAAFYGAAVDRLGEDGARECFGNLVLSRLPVLHCFRHLLPQPAAPAEVHMPRQATEVVVLDQSRAVRITTTHLEFHVARHRLAQIERLRWIHREACANARAPGEDPGPGPYRLVPRPETAVLCGDLNVTPGDPEYADLTDGFEDHTPPLVDAWRLLHGRTAHAPTCGVHDRDYWEEGPHCRDYFLVTPDLGIASDPWRSTRRRRHRIISLCAW
jgi:endonuclease/exonuclease/phosphatase family metal-dependent hydrolase